MKESTMVTTIERDREWNDLFKESLNKHYKTSIQFRKKYLGKLFPSKPRVMHVIRSQKNLDRFNVTLDPFCHCALCLSNRKIIQVKEIVDRTYYRDSENAVLEIVHDISKDTPGWAKCEGLHVLYTCGEYIPKSDKQPEDIIRLVRDVIFFKITPSFLREFTYNERYPALDIHPTTYKKDGNIFTYKYKSKIRLVPRKTIVNHFEKTIGEEK